MKNAWLAGSVLSLIVSAFPAAAGVQLACAGPGADAALVIDTGGGVTRYCVALPDDSVDGIELIELASDQYGLSYGLGYGGQAVCMLEGVGSDEERCFHGGEPFWGYWRGTSSGGWSWSGTGAAGTSVEDGDVEGWAWGTGNDGNSHPQPPATTHESVCGVEEEPEPQENDKDEDKNKPRSGSQDNKGDGPRDNSDNEAPEGSGGDDPDDSTDDLPAAIADGDRPARSGPRETKKPTTDREADKKGAKSRSGEPGGGSASPSPSATDGATETDTSGTAARDPGSASEGPPIVGLVGLAIAIGLGLMGAWFLKKKHAPTP